jgi:hypothetical protein
MLHSRRFASLFAATSFLLMGLSGALSFLAAYTERLAGIHTIAGFAFLLAAGGHLWHNARTLARYVPGQRRWVPNRAAVFALVVTSALLAGSFFRARPIAALMAWGKEQREAGLAKKTTYETITLDARGDGPLLTLDVKAGPYFRFREKAHGWQITPQIAAWMEDENGRYVETLYVSNDLATHTRMPDVVSGASPEDNTYLVARAHTPMSRFYVLVELNSSFDYNDYYSQKAFPDDPAYNDGGNPAQPSVVYRALVDRDAPARFTVMTAIGHGHHAGKDGRIDPDLSHLTTALAIADRIVVGVDWGTPRSSG